MSQEGEHTYGSDEGGQVTLRLSLRLSLRLQEHTRNPDPVQTVDSSHVLRKQGSAVETLSSDLEAFQAVGTRTRCVPQPAGHPPSV